MNFHEPILDNIQTTALVTRPLQYGNITYDAFSEEKIKHWIKFMMTNSEMDESILIEKYFVPLLNILKIRTAEGVLLRKNENNNPYMAILSERSIIDCYINSNTLNEVKRIIELVKSGFCIIGNEIKTGYKIKICNGSFKEEYDCEFINDRIIPTKKEVSNSNEFNSFELNYINNNEFTIEAKINDDLCGNKCIEFRAVTKNNIYNILDERSLMNYLLEINQTVAIDGTYIAKPITINEILINILKIINIDINGYKSIKTNIKEQPKSYFSLDLLFKPENFDTINIEDGKIVEYRITDGNLIIGINKEGILSYKNKCTVDLNTINNNTSTSDTTKTINTMQSNFSYFINQSNEIVKILRQHR